MNIWQYFKSCFVNSFRRAFATTRGISFILTIIGYLVTWLWPNLFGKMTVLLWVIPLFILYSALICACSVDLYKYKSFKRQVIEIKTVEDFDSALGLYQRRMRRDEQHNSEHLYRWWKDEQDTAAEDRESREIFLIAKQNHKTWWILFATCPNDSYLLNVYGFANRKRQKSDVDEWESPLKVTEKLVDILKNDLETIRKLIFP